MPYHIIQYEDDTLVIMSVDHTQIANLQSILKVFSDFTGLQVNYNKSSLVPINITDEGSNQLVNILGCKKEAMPYTYLGLPMGTTRPKVDDLMHMVASLDNRLSGIASVMSYAGRLTHLKAVINALLIFGMCCIGLPFTILNHFEKSRRGFLWYGKRY